jgi:hypothetical protein
MLNIKLYKNVGNVQVSWNCKVKFFRKRILKHLNEVWYSPYFTCKCSKVVKYERYMRGERARNESRENIFCGQTRWISEINFIASVYKVRKNVHKISALTTMPLFKHFHIFLLFNINTEWLPFKCAIYLL